MRLFLALFLAFTLPGSASHVHPTANSGATCFGGVIHKAPESSDSTPAPSPAPTVSAISPTSGSTAGGTAVSITGTGFLTGATAAIGGTTCTSPSVVNSTTLTCTTGARSAATVSVVVTNTDAQSGTGSGLYTYVTPFVDVKSIDCDGTNDFGSVAGSAVNAYFAHNAAFSFSIWVKPDATSGERTFFSTRDSGAAYKGFMVEANGTQSLNQLNTAAAAATLTSNSAFTAGSWTHIVMTYSGGSNLNGLKFYKNGSLTATGGSQAISASTVTTVNAQFCNDPQSSFFNGKIGDSAVFNTELNSTQVTEIYNAAKGVNLAASTVSANVKHWWLMGDFASDDNTTIYDQIGSANITLTNGPTVITDAP